MLNIKRAPQSAKRTIRIPNILRPIEKELTIFPRGFISALKECSEVSSSVKRVEVFATEKTESFGILRTLTVAYSAARCLLQMAEISNNVIQVSSLSRSGSTREQSKRSLVNDRLILKRLDKEDNEREGYSIKAPGLHVPGRWLERFDLEDGERIIVSNPREKYFVPPPSIVQ